MARRRQIYEGKAKILYEGPEPGTLIQYFKDDATAFNAQKKGTINGKGVLNNRISEHVFTLLGGIGIPTHFIRRLNMPSKPVVVGSNPTGRANISFIPALPGDQTLRPR